MEHVGWRRFVVASTFLIGITVTVGTGCNPSGGGDGANDNGATTNTNTNTNANTNDNAANENGGPDVPPRADLVDPRSLTYVGAFRLPLRAAGAPDAQSWEYSGQALAYRADGDPDGDDDGFPGSLFGTGHDVTNNVGEISIPVPIHSRNLDELNRATTLQDFEDIRGGLFDPFVEIPRVGLEHLPAHGARSSARLYMAWGQHFHEEVETTIPTHAWRDPDLSTGATDGAWWVANESLYSVNGYLFSAPQAWADAFLAGRSLLTGRFRDGGWSGMGPSLFAIGPWQHGDPPAAGTRLDADTLLLYSNTRGGDSAEFQLTGYQHSDEWTGGAWITSGDQSAVVFAGTKGSGYLWYGFTSPGGDGMPCVEQNLTMVGCFDPDGVECPAAMSNFCEGNIPESRGWWSSRFDAQMLFYDPADLAAVLAGEMEPYEPQPYATLDLDDNFFLGDTVEPIMLGTGDQRRFRVGEMTFDREGGLLYIPEPFADEAQPIIHVWRVGAVAGAG